MFKKVTSLLIAFCLTSLLAVPVFSNGSSTSVGTDKNENSECVKAKLALKEKADNEYKKYKESKKRNVSEEEKNNLLMSLVSDPAADKEKIKKELKTYGVYLLEYTSAEQAPVSIMSQGGDVSMSSPIISYSSSSNTWIVSGGGYWKNSNWFNDITNVWWGYSGETKNVGYADGFGVGYTSTNSKYKSRIISQYAQMSDGNGNISTTTTRSDGDGSKGFGFQIQDYIKLNVVDRWVDAEDCSYMGKHFAGQVTYDSNFALLDGVATSYYIHTYSNASIKSVTFGISGKSAGIDATIENEYQSFPGYSTDVRF